VAKCRSRVRVPGSVHSSSGYAATGWSCRNSLRLRHVSTERGSFIEIERLLVSAPGGATRGEHGSSLHTALSKARNGGVQGAKGNFGRGPRTHARAPLSVVVVVKRILGTPAWCPTLLLMCDCLGLRRRRRLAARAVVRPPAARAGLGWLAGPKAIVPCGGVSHRGGTVETLREGGA